jgi:hypothetical protein
MRRSRRPIAIFASLLMAATFAAAQSGNKVVWKLVDSKGKVSYSDAEPAKNFDGKVTRIEVDLAANRATLINRHESSPPVLLPLTAPELKRVRAEAKLAEARDALEAARKALEEGREPKPEETQWLGKQGGGARPVATDAYRERIADLETAIKAAETEVKSAEQAARQASID